MTKMLSFTPDLKLPIDLLMQPIGLLGNRGGGKTYSGMKLFEAAHDAGVQCIAVDIVGKWWALRLGADGTSNGGLSDVFIFGGKHADFPINADQGAFVAKVIAGRRIHAVLDLSLMRKGDRRRFLTDFAEEYFLLKKQEEVPSPCVLFLEEGHAVLPQKPAPDEARMLGAFQDLVAEGRNAGIGVVVMDQRPATCNKNALALVEVLIVLRTTYKSDRDVYEDWVVQKGEDEGGSARVELAKKLPFLKTGEAYIYAPQFEIFSRIHIAPKRTFDSSATVKIGAKSAVVGTLTPVDVERLKGDMAEVLAKAKADDPRALRARIAELEKVGPQLAPPPKPVEIPVLHPQELERLERCVESLRISQESLGFAIKEVLAGLLKATPFGARQATKPYPPPGYRGEWTADVKANFPTNAPLHFKARKALGHQDLTTNLSQLGPQGVSPDGLKLKAGARLMAGVLACYPGGLARRELGAMSGINPTSGTFSEYINALIRAGTVAVTADRKLTSNAAPIPTTWADVLERWRGDFKLGARSMLETLRKHDRMSRAALGEVVGISPTSGTFSEYISALKRAGLVEDEDRQVFINPTLAAL